MATAAALPHAAPVSRDHLAGQQGPRTTSNQPARSIGQLCGVGCRQTVPEAVVSARGRGATHPRVSPRLSLLERRTHAWPWRRVTLVFLCVSPSLGSGLQPGSSAGLTAHPPAISRRDALRRRLLAVGPSKAFPCARHCGPFFLLVTVAAHPLPPPTPCRRPSSAAAHPLPPPTPCCPLLSTPARSRVASRPCAYLFLPELSSTCVPPKAHLLLAADPGP